MLFELNPTDPYDPRNSAVVGFSIVYFVRKTKSNFIVRQYFNEISTYLDTLMNFIKPIWSVTQNCDF